MSNLVEHAKTELKLAGIFDKDSDYAGMLGGAVMELVEVFAKQGHSGASAGRTLQLFNKVANFKPLLSLTLKDDEWGEVSNGVFQNKRNSAVFKDSKDGRAYYIDAYYKKTQKGSTWSGPLEVCDGHVGRCYIKDTKKMPRICIDVIEKEITKDDWEMKIKDIKQLDELRKYYDFSIIPPKDKP